STGLVTFRQLAEHWRPADRRRGWGRRARLGNGEDVTDRHAIRIRGKLRIRGEQLGEGQAVSAGDLRERVTGRDRVAHRGHLLDGSIMRAPWRRGNGLLVLRRACAILRSMTCGSR